MPTSFFQTACEIVAPKVESIVPWASASPPWSGPHPSQIGPTYGTLFASPAADGSWRLDHDTAGRFFALTLFHEPGDVEVHMGRRWRVVRLIGPAPKSVAARVAVRGDAA